MPTQLLDQDYDICVVGGAGHVGLPLAIVFADRGLRVLALDINQATVEEIRDGRMPFVEYGAEPLLRKVLDEQTLTLTTEPEDLSRAVTIILTIGTPIDEFLSPDTKVMRRWLEDSLPYFQDGQLLVLRSTLYPGTTNWLYKYLEQNSEKHVDVAYCPERIAQGYAIQELPELPQLVSGVNRSALTRAVDLFKKLAPHVVVLEPLEAEFAKLFTNAYRYIQFAAANQFYMIAEQAGTDYNRILSAMKLHYSRAHDIPGAGLAAGPCLLKDTMQLAASSDNSFTLGNAAMSVNEGLALYMTRRIRQKYPLEDQVVGLLGMAFKANSDDIRSSLSYRIKRVLQFHAKDVLTTDPHVTVDPRLLPLDTVLARSDLLVLCTPHDAYKGLDTGAKPVVDVWGFLGRGSMI